MADNTAAIAQFLRDIADQMEGVGATATYHNAILVMQYNSGSPYGENVIVATPTMKFEEVIGLLQLAIMDANTYHIQGEGRTENVSDYLENP